MKILPVKTKSKHYNIYIGYNVISQLNKIINKEKIKFKKALLVVDRKIPKYFIKRIKSKINSEKKLIYFFNNYKTKLKDKIINIENKLINLDPKKNLKNGFTIIYDIDDNIIDNSSLFKSLSKMKMKIVFDDDYKFFTIDRIIE